MKKNVKYYKYVLALMWLFVMLMLPEPAKAGEAQRYIPVPEITEAYVNPLYRDVSGPEDLKWPDPFGMAPMAEDAGYVTEQAAAKSFREQMKQRRETISVSVVTTADKAGLLRRIADAAMEHTGNPAEGDYLKWQYEGWRGTLGGYSSEGTQYLTLTYTMTYYTDAQQEKQADSAVASVVSALGLKDGSRSNYEKICAIYDYICQNVTYDYANLNNTSYKLKHTAYAALIKKTAVCQGYAVLFYRLALESGIDARLIPGQAGNALHGWNIVKLGERYYNLDATWDAGRSQYAYFLKGAAFSGHTRSAEYLTAEFSAAYPMSELEYQAGCIHVPDSPVKENEKAASCTQSGFYESVTYCKSCHEEISREFHLVPAAAHTAKAVPGRAASCCANGLTEGQVCRICGTVIVQQSVIPATGHLWGAWKTTAKATVFAPEKQQAACSICGAVKTQETGKKLSPKINVTATKLSMQRKQATKAFRVTFANGDSVKSWKSGNTRIVKVSGRPDGTCTIAAQNKTGTTKITITLKSGKKAVITVKVQKGKVTAKSVKLSTSRLTLKNKQKLALKPVVSPVTCQEKIKYSSSNNRIVKVNSKGVITGVRPGKAKIKVKAGRKTFTCTVTVKK